MKFIIEKDFHKDDQYTYLWVTAYCIGADSKDLLFMHRTLFGIYKTAETANKCVKDMENLLNASEIIKHDVIVRETVQESPNSDWNDQGESDDNI